MDYTKTAKLFKAYADENRLRILSMLSEEEKCACVLLEELDISQSTLSHHMKLLSEECIVKARKDGKWTHYSLSEEGPAHIKQVLAELEGMKNSSCCGNKKEELSEEDKALFR